MYHLPLLPGYGLNVNVRSSAPAKSPSGQSILSRLSEAEENGYDGTYFAESNEEFSSDGFIPSSSPTETRRNIDKRREGTSKRTISTEDQWSEVIVFAYGVIVFFGMDETQEHLIIDDLDSAGTFVRRIEEASWEIEQCHYAVSCSLISFCCPATYVYSESARP